MKVKAVKKEKTMECKGCIALCGLDLCLKIKKAYLKKFKKPLVCIRLGIVWIEKPIEYHKRCHDCGKFVKKSEWVRKDHPWKEHAVCWRCRSGYTEPNDY